MDKVQRIIREVDGKKEIVIPKIINTDIGFQLIFGFYPPASQLSYSKSGSPIRKELVLQRDCNEFIKR
tara:strand:- start:404 stop:607 length:204 start_codon:yes stop_codon:yes gene_type:complete